MMTQACSFRVSVIIPTKNRAADLVRTIETLLTQTVQPFELIIVDQSAERSFTKQIATPVRYIHDPNLSGASAARNAAMELAQGEIWLFLDDDVFLEPNFIEEILKTYDVRVAGVSGIITNYSTPPLRQRLWERIFQTGPFRDERQAIYRNAGWLRESRPLRVRQFGGGLMSFRASATRGKRFDTNLTGPCPGEDIEFCAGFGKDDVLLITPRARLVHNRSPENRDSVHWLSVHAQVSYYMYERHWRRGIWNRVCYLWLNAGYAILTAYSCLKGRSVAPWRAWREGAQAGRDLGCKVVRK